MTLSEEQILQEALEHVGRRWRAATSERDRASLLMREIVPKAKEAGYSLTAIAQILGVSRQQIYLILWDGPKAPTATAESKDCSKPS
jgi:hypothetical protein